MAIKAKIGSCLSALPPFFPLLTRSALQRLVLADSRCGHIRPGTLRMGLHFHDRRGGHPPRTAWPAGWMDRPRRERPFPV